MRDETRPVIAVFGGAKDDVTLDAAELVGYEIGLSRAILLTGGDDPKAGDLKARVLRGAGRAHDEGATAPWVGIVRSSRAVDPRSAANGLSLVLTPGGDHLRNYVEADLCDVAIAFAGGDGTCSEVVFCLALGKPLVLVGDTWRSRYPVVSGAVARGALKDEAQRRVQPRVDDHPRLAPLIVKAYERFDQALEPSFQHFALSPVTSASAVARAMIQAAETGVYPDGPAVSLRADESAAFQQFRVLPR